jgi:hypothetical protein
MDLASGLARRVLIRAGVKSERSDLLSPDIAEFRRAPVLATFGYVLDLCTTDVRAAWAQGVERLRGRDAFPGDGDSFVHNPQEVLGIYAGLGVFGASAAEQMVWLRTLMRRGLTEGKLKTPISRYAAALVLAGESEAILDEVDIREVESPRLLLACAMTLAFAPSWEARIGALEAAVLRQMLSAPLSVADAGEAAAATIVVERLIDRLSLSLQDNGSATERIVSLCRRFPYFVNQLQKRQRGRVPIKVDDEYDVQDLLHAILKLHFVDVRPEEPSPSFGGKPSRVDFFLPTERIVVEAKKTRQTLKQDKLVSELIDDTARYSKMESVDTLICLVYDPDGYCTVPQAIESDVGASASRLIVRVVVCPQRS